ncbi:MAG: hypothetical protein DME12_01805 [Candidatus Rokuibacteriota bacterium]|nr:MAG: hypothetical protein DME12_01805 [Candidatus Rokubacteria bacterium]PYN69351.1 MAG: hypothetical protein DMD93_07455 [Candidatus Rokubacteria bacterium]
MKAFNWRSTTMWTTASLLFLLLALMVGPAPALAGGVAQGVGLVLYEVTEDMYLLDQYGVPTVSLANAARRSAVAQLSGTAQIGTPLCPWEVLVIAPGAKNCTVNATGADDLWLGGPKAGTGTVSGKFAVVVQGDNKHDAPEFVVMTGWFGGDADLSLPFAGKAPIGYLTNGVVFIDADHDGQQGSSDPAFKFSGKFRLPYGLDKRGNQLKPRRYQDSYYMTDDWSSVGIEGSERSLGWPTVRLEIKF